MSRAPVNENSPGSTPGRADSAVVRGHGPVVVFVPGLGLDGSSWEPVRYQLLGQSSVVLLPSLGQPAPRGTDLLVERQAERLVQRMPKDKQVILVGHSAGCPVVVAAAAHTSDIVGLVLVGPVTDPSAQTWPRMLTQWARTASHESPREAVILVPQYRRTGALGMLRGMNAMRDFRTDLALSRLSLPVEIVRGDQDRIASLEWTSVLRRVSEARLTTIRGAAHMVPLTHPAAVSSAIERLRLVTTGDCAGPAPSMNRGYRGGMTDTASGECSVCLAEDPPVHTAATATEDGKPVCAAHAAGDVVTP